MIIEQCSIMCMLDWNCVGGLTKLVTVCLYCMLTGRRTVYLKRELAHIRSTNTFLFGAGQFCYTCSRHNPSSNMYVMYTTFRELALFRFLTGLL